MSITSQSSLEQIAEQCGMEIVSCSSFESNSPYYSQEQSIHKPGLLKKQIKKDKQAHSTPPSMNKETKKLQNKSYYKIDEDELIDNCGLSTPSTQIQQSMDNCDIDIVDEISTTDLVVDQKSSEKEGDSQSKIFYKCRNRIQSQEDEDEDNSDTDEDDNTINLYLGPSKNNISSNSSNNIQYSNKQQ